MSVLAKFGIIKASKQNPNTLPPPTVLLNLYFFGSEWRPVDLPGYQYNKKPLFWWPRLGEKETAKKNPQSWVLLALPRSQLGSAGQTQMVPAGSKAHLSHLARCNRGTCLCSYIPVFSHLPKCLLEDKLLFWVPGLPPSWWLDRVVLLSSQLCAAVGCDPRDHLVPLPLPGWLQLSAVSQVDCFKPVCFSNVSSLHEWH